ncbi:hypothetical protein C3K47_13990 [Solitalea longa]|uniref:DUF177 domain-containing protein n=1 Tax=Solitalea longa TaxID=2079460 RepID=A0A2S4ZZW6_9SPHI|nr:DUF177 domain-containing protein [Solitalea longa]POY35856.1 hypothetical protein C3K47_13990 [Solitalea longa]
MKPNKAYIIPFVGLKLGNNEFEYSIDKKFFDEFEYSLVKNGDVKVHLTFNKQETMFILDFFIKGTIEVACDRCLAPYPHDIEVNERQIVKLSDSDINEEGEIIVISRAAYEYDVAPLIYEYINLQVPIITACDGQQSFCDQEMISKLNELRTEETESDEKPIDPRWDALKNFGEN